jgi:hypothetical protein
VDDPFVTAQPIHRRRDNSKSNASRTTTPYTGLLEVLSDAKALVRAPEIRPDTFS